MKSWIGQILESYHVDGFLRVDYGKRIYGSGLEGICFDMSIRRILTVRVFHYGRS